MVEEKESFYEKVTEVVEENGKKNVEEELKELEEKAEEKKIKDTAEKLEKENKKVEERQEKKEKIRTNSVKYYSFKYDGKPTFYVHKSLKLEDKNKWTVFDRVEHTAGEVIFYNNEKVIYAFKRANMTNIVMRK